MPTNEEMVKSEPFDEEEPLSDYYSREWKMAEQRLQDMVRKNQMYENKLDLFDQYMKRLLSEKDVIIKFLSDKLGLNDDNY